MRRVIDDLELAGMEREARAALLYDPAGFSDGFETDYVTPFNVVALIERLRRAERCPCGAGQSA